MKNLLAMVLALVLTTSICSAAPAKSTAGSDLTNAIKKDVNAAKEAIKKDVNNANKEAQAKKEAQNKDKKAALKTKRDEQINSIDNQIKTKKQQIKDTKKSSTMTETEKTIKTRAYERQIEALEAKKAKIDEVYKKSVEALK